jgi:hypothetical protein
MSVSLMCVMSMTLALAVSAFAAGGAEPVKVFVLAGQSNAEGLGVVKELPDSAKAPPKDVTAWMGNEKGWQAGLSFRPEGFGPEISLAAELAGALKGRKIAIIKYGPGGTNLAVDWKIGEGPCWKHFAATVQAALKALSDSGQPYEIAGLFWMQGESDAMNEAMAAKYEANLTAFIQAVRELVKAPKMPFVLGRITSALMNKKAAWSFPSTRQVQQAQDKVAKEVPGVYVFDTDDLPTYPDFTHYTTKGQLELGKRFAKAYLASTKSAATSPASKPARD